ncbi:MAG TPA: nitroreductase [Acidimicrobiales bacterium]|nr:nitroreductase [Acidimicrobiales bacterium]
MIEAIFERRSISRLVEPAPSDEELRLMLSAAAAAPDHGELRPWRFVVLRGAAKDRFGEEVFVPAYLARCADPVPGAVEKERTKLSRAPLVVVVAAVRRESDAIPWEEQYAGAAAAVQNLLLAATALGYGSMWRTGEQAYDPRVKAALGLREEDAVVGFVYLGTVPEGKEKPPREPDLDGLVEVRE